MPDITIERVQQEYEEHPYATPLEHVSNVTSETNESDQQSESEES